MGSTGTGSKLDIKNKACNLVGMAESKEYTLLTYLSGTWGHDLPKIYLITYSTSHYRQGSKNVLYSIGISPARLPANQE